MMRRRAILVPLMLLVAVLSGCLFRPANRFGDDRWDNHNWGPVYARMDLSCVKCDSEETVEVRLSYGLLMDAYESETLWIVLETEGFEQGVANEILVEGLDESYEMTAENGRYALPKSMDFTIRLEKSGFQYGTIRVLFYKDDERSDPLKTVQLGYVNDEQGLIFDDTTEYAMKTSLRRLHNAGVIDRAEFIRRDAEWSLDGSLAMPSTTRSATSIAIEYHSSSIRVKRIVPIDDPLAALYLEIEAMYEEIWEREHMFSPDWMKEEFQELAEAYVNYLYAHEWIDNETWNAELQEIPNMRVHLAFLGSMQISFDRFGLALWNDYYTIE